MGHPLAAPMIIASILGLGGTAVASRQSSQAQNRAAGHATEQADIERDRQAEAEATRRQERAEDLANQERIRQGEIARQREAEERAIQREEEERRRQEAERDRQEAEAQAAEQRRYDAAMEDFSSAMDEYHRMTSNRDEWANYWEDVAESPGTMHPEFGAFKRELGRAANASRGTTSDVLRRRGVTGGAQEKLLMETQEKTESTLADALITLSNQARGQAFDVRNMSINTPQRPTLGDAMSYQIQRPTMGSMYSPTGVSYSPGQQVYSPILAETYMPSFQIPDFSELGSMLAYTSQQGDTEAYLSSLPNVQGDTSPWQIPHDEFRWLSGEQPSYY